MGGILILGAFGFREQQFGGQTNKTKNLLYLMRNHNLNPDCFDTQDFKYNKFHLFKMCWQIIKCKTLYYVPAHNNLKYLFPIIYILSKISSTTIHYFVVGGWLKEFLDELPWHRKKLSKVAGIHCETNLMKTLLENEFGYNNVDVFPNFRVNNYIPKIYHEDSKIKLVFMARILKMKGIDTIFKMCDLIREKELDKKIIIDFYGPLDVGSDDANYFNSNLGKHDFVSYYGTINPEEIYRVLEKYDVMLLPTHFYTEGLPGSIVDAYMSKIPVIVTRWKHASEFVEDGQTGFIIPFDDDGTALLEAVMKLYEDPQLLNKLKEASYIKSYDFSELIAWELFKQYV